MKIFLQPGLDSDSTDFFLRATLAADVGPGSSAHHLVLRLRERVTRIAPKFAMTESTQAAFRM
jgi:hypothetical protein